MKVTNLINKRFGKLLVVSRQGSNKKGNALWKCVCDCGNESIVVGYKLTGGHTKSCGCLKLEILATSSYKHGLSNSRIFKIWTGMIARCNYHVDTYKNYSLRGIKVCNEWKDFLTFYKWAMANGYKDNLTIDRIDNNGNYEPSNCRWADRYIQNNNTRKNVKVTAHGETKTVAEWSRKTGINVGTIYVRIRKKHCSPEIAVTEKKNLRTRRNLILNTEVKRA